MFAIIIEIFFFSITFIFLIEFSLLVNYIPLQKIPQREENSFNCKFIRFIFFSTNSFLHVSIFTNMKIKK